MTEKQFENAIPTPQDPYIKLLKFIITVVGTILVVIGVCLFLFYLTFNLPYIRANIAIALAKGRVTSLYEHLTAITPTSVKIVEKQDVQSGVYAFALSDSADQYAHVWAKLILESNSPSTEVIATYSNSWLTSGLAQIVEEKPDTIASLFRSFDGESLLVGMCNPNVSSERNSYTIFIDYADGPRCDSSAGTFYCVASRYCTKP